VCKPRTDSIRRIPIKILSVIGTRPQYIKVFPMVNELSSAGHDHVVVDSGQHYDTRLSSKIIADLGLEPPSINLRVGSGSHAHQVSEVLKRTSALLSEVNPDIVLVYGDTNTTLGAGLAVAKSDIPLVHIEAGLRSDDMSMAEEINRRAVDHISDLCLSPTKRAQERLRAEGLGSKSVLVGDLTIDALIAIRSRPTSLPMLFDGKQGSYFVATLHRAQNTDSIELLEGILKSLSSFPDRVYLILHPRLRDFARRKRIVLEQGAVKVLPPQPYSVMIATLRESKGLITDSGGLQKEAYFLGIPTTTIRRSTEWPETTVGGWNKLVTNVDEIKAHAYREKPSGSPESPFGTGNAAQNIVSALESRFHT